MLYINSEFECLKCGSIFPEGEYGWDEKEEVPCCPDCQSTQIIIIDNTEE